MKTQNYWRLIVACSLPFALTSWAQSFPNGNPGDWSDSNTGNSIEPVITSPVGGPNGGFTLLNNLYPSQDNGPYSFFGVPGFNTSPIGAFTQTISVYLNPANVLEQSGGFWIDETPDATGNTPQYGTPQLWGAENNFRLTGTGSGIDVNVNGGPTIGDITTAGWYSFQMNFTPGAPGTPVTTYLSVYDQSASDALVGSASEVATDEGTGTYLSQDLGGAGYVWLTDWDNGFAANSLAVADVSVVPDSGSAVTLLGFGLAGLGWMRRRSVRG